MKTWEKLRADPDLWPRYLLRANIYKIIRQFFEKEKFQEIDTPLLIANPPAESYLEVFQTTLLDRNRRATSTYLSTSPEVPLKKLLVAGVGNCYSLTKSFRNMETQSLTHNPEFTILEWYRTGVNYEAIMADCENMVLRIAESLGKGSQLTYSGKCIDLSSPWQRLTVSQAFSTYAKIDFNDFLNESTAKKIAQEKGYSVADHNTWEELYNQIFLNEIEPHLGLQKPVILCEFPGSMAALSKRKPSDPRFAERFEFYIAGLELGDCYSELTDWQEQESRFKAELKEIKRLGRTEYDYDHDFIRALQSGLPECSGIAVGLDRLIMLFADVPDIADTLFFPGKELFAEKG